MISIEKLELLDKKVKEAVGLIQSLKEANAELKEENALLMERIDELETESRSIQDDQELIEETIQDAIVQLEKAHDTLAVESEVRIKEPKKAAPEPEADPEQDSEEDSLDESEGDVSDEEAAEKAAEDEELPGYAYQPPAGKSDTVTELYQDDDDGDEEISEEDDFFSDRDDAVTASGEKGDELEIF